MKIITIEEEAWEQLNSRINAIAEYLKKIENTSYDDLWLIRDNFKKAIYSY